ncbi:MAG: hypothetical protein KatS3mg064_1898 [Tepidiforma sp.]|nr:hypothetical protein [Tepidiforma sp.]GIW18741.1 MAG: hypothetical protein KatS3mg064_1898 [Tepidiforma sp.]
MLDTAAVLARVRELVADELAPMAVYAAGDPGPPAAAGRSGEPGGVHLPRPDARASR